MSLFWVHESIIVQLHAMKIHHSDIKIAFVLAHEDLKDRYRRSYAGMAWIVISFVGFFGVKLLVFSEILSNTKQIDYSLWLLSGYYAWMLLSGLVLGGANSFNSSRNFILSQNLPNWIYILRNIIYHQLVAIYTSIGFFILLYFTSFEFHLHQILSLASLLMLYSILSFFWSMFAGIVTIFFKDFYFFIETIMKILFFATPIFWIPVEGSFLSDLNQYNIFFHLIQIFRMPIMSGEIPVYSLYFVLMATPLFLLIGSYTYLRYSNKISLKI